MDALSFAVIGLGVSTVDIVARVEHLPTPDDVQRALDMTTQGGGPVATAMVTLARLGARAAMIDALGDDWRGGQIREGFTREGVNVAHLKTRPGHTSAMSCILVEQASGARSIVYAPGTAPDITPAELPVDAIASARFLHLNGRHWEAGLEAIRIARSAGVQVSFDGGAGRYRPELDDLIPQTDICIVARDFAEQHTHETDIRAAAGALLRMGPRLVAITDGARGSWVLARDGRFFHQPAYLFPSAVDTTGCGDSYHGAFLFGLLRGLTLEKTAALASAVAALNSQAIGGRGGLPTYAQVVAFLDGLAESI
ncbi:MAG TPA: PfkB family carbohydrate kinase [Thermoflexales bacterium]|nr:PfkB family carbohydrate kinase [Thermoflexales bacterium]HQX10544.1 PfkB family carbohydrate kinase [Thermoflexales bacterium]HQZ53295.1 PfkB family carbohydrate kinase [Thermoflexales bacterium]